jgi:hypothetical protein
MLEQAVETATVKVPILREMLGMAIRWHDHGTARDASAALAAATPDPYERSALTRERYQLLLGEFQNAEEGLSLLSAALDDPACTEWAPDTARLVAALGRDEASLARAHRKLAQRERKLPLRIAHSCAAARASPPSTCG